MSTANFDVPGLPLPVAVRRIGTARRMRLRVDHRAGLIRLTVPAKASAKAALQWAREQGPWIDTQLASAPLGVPFLPGASIPFKGSVVQLDHVPAMRRGVVLDGVRLEIGGPLESFARTVERWLRQQALETLSDETARVAALAGVSVSSVSIGDAVTRWGSCTSGGAIRYSWRLVLAPPEALRFVVAHEVAHRIHLDHSRRFKAVERQLFGGPVEPVRTLLRQLAPSLRAIGRH